MRLLVLGGTRFLGRHVVTAALDRGHEVATFTRGVSGAPPGGRPRAARRPRRSRRRCPRRSTAGRPSSSSTPRARPAPPPATPPRRWPTCAATPSSAASTPTRTGRPGPIGPRTTSRPGTPTTTTTARTRRSPSAILGAALGDRFLTARAGLIVGPYDPLYRLGWWLDRIAAAAGSSSRRGPRPADRARRRPRPGRLAGRAWPSSGQGGAVNTTGPAGMTTLGGLLDLCREVTGGDAEWVPVPEADLLGGRRRRSGCTCRCGCRRRRPAPAWDVDTTRARELGLPSRPLRESVADTWAWQRAHDRPPPPPHRPEPGLPPSWRPSCSPPTDRSVSDSAELFSRGGAGTAGGHGGRRVTG